MEKELLENENLQAVKERQFAIAKTCVRMAYMLREYDFRISKICGLTAFALDTTFDSLNLVNRLYWTVKFTAATSSESKVNPATLYEIERLLEPLRPNVLDPEFTWKKIIPLCKRYKTERDVLLKESCQYVPVLRDPKQSLKYFKKGNSTNSASSSVSQVPTDTESDAKSKKVQEKELKRPTAVDIDRLLGQQFPRGVGKSMEDYSMKDLDKTINDLKKSINEETEYRKMLHIAGFTGKEKKQKSPGPPKGPAIKKEKVKKEPKQEQQRSISKTTIPQTHNQSSKVPQNISGQSHQQPYQGGDKVVPLAAHRSTPGPFSPPVAHQSSPGFRSPPVAHASHHLLSPRDLISPKPSGSSQYSSQVYRQNSSPGQFSPSYTPGSVNQKASLPSSSSYRPPSVSPTASDALKQSLNTKIHSELLRKSQHLSGSVSQLNTGSSSSSNLQRQHSVPNLPSSLSNENLKQLHTSTASSSPAECARIAQQIAQMHLKQRAEREKLEGKKPRKPRQKKVQETPKTSLTSKSVVSKTHISEMLNQTMKTGVETNSERVQNIVHIRNKILQAESTNRLTADNRQINPNVQQQGNMANPNMLSSTSNLNPQTARSDSFQKNIAGHSEQIDPRTQNPKFYLTTASVIDKLKKGETGGVNLTDSKGLSVKTMFSMVVSRALTMPDNQQELVRCVTDMVKKATSAKDSSGPYQVSSGSNTVSLGASTPHVHSNVRPTSSSTIQPKQKTMEEIRSTPVPDHVLEFLKTKSKGEQQLQKSEPNQMLVRNVNKPTQDQNRSTMALQSSTTSTRPATVTSRQQVHSSGFPPTNTNMGVAANASGDVNSNAVSQLTAMTGVVLPQNQSSLNMLANVATNSVSLPGQQQSKIPATYGNQNQVSNVSGVPPNSAMTTRQPTQNLLQPNIPQLNTVPQPTLQQNTKFSTQSRTETRIRLPVTSEQSEQRFMHVFDQFGNKQIVNMTPQTHLMPIGSDKTVVAQTSPGTQAQQAMSAAQNNLSQQSLSNSGPQQQIAPSTGSINNFIPLQPTFSTVASDPTGTLLSQMQTEGLNVSNTGGPGMPQMGSTTEGTTAPRQQFNIVPELSPAVVQQILTDLMKTGSQQDHTSPGQKTSTISPQSQNPPQQHKREIYIIPKSLADRTVDGTMQIMKDSSSGSIAKSVLDHTKQILSGQGNPNDMKLVSGSSMMNRSLNQNFQANAVPNFTSMSTQSNYQQPSVVSSSVSNLNQLNQTVHNSTSGQFYSQNYMTSSSALGTSQIPNRTSSAMRQNTVPITLSQTNMPNQLLQVPDLPDLNQFGIDEILRTDNVADQINQRSEIVEKQPQKQPVVNRNNEVNVNQTSAISRNETAKTMSQQVPGNSSTGSGEDMIKISSDLDMLKHVESILSGKKKVTLAKQTGQIVKQEWKSEQQNLKPDSSASAYAQNKAEPGPVNIHRQQNTVEQKPAISPLAGPSNMQHEQVESKVSPAKSTFFNAARLAKEREEREMKIKQEKPITKNTEDKLPVKVCGICSQTFNSIEKLKEHVQFNLCPSKQCKLCDRMFSSLDELKNHLKVPCKVQKGKHLKDFEYTKIFVCSKCNFTSQNEKIGTKHVENCNVSRSPVKAKVTIWFKCHMCREVLHDKDLAYKHISRFCPQLKAAKAQQDVQYAMDKLKSKTDRVVYPKKPDSPYKDPKSFIQDCFVPENSRGKDIKQEMHINQKETTKTDKRPHRNTSETKGSSSDRLLPVNVKVEGNRSEIEMEKEETLRTPLENSKQNTLNSDIKPSSKDGDIPETQVDTNKTTVYSNNEGSIRDMSETMSSDTLESKFVRKEKEEAGDKVPDSVCKPAIKLEELDIDKKKVENVKKLTDSNLAETKKAMSDVLKKDEENKNKEENKRMELEKSKLSENKTPRSADLRLRTPRKAKTEGTPLKHGENQSPKPLSSPKKGKTPESDSNESQSTCKLCLYSTSNHRSLARHYTQAHDFGFKLQNKRYRCKYCDISFQSSSKVKIKGHLIKHSEILLSQIAKCKHLNKNYPHLTPEKNTKKEGNTVFSPRRMKKHMKARAARSKCAENLKRLSYGHKKGVDDENTSDSESEGRSRSESPEQMIMGRPRKYPVGQEPYRINRSLYMQKYYGKGKMEKQQNILVSKKKKNQEEIRVQQYKIKTRHGLLNKSRSNSVNSNVSDKGTCARRSMQNSNKEPSRISTRSHPGKDRVETGSLQKEIKDKVKLDERMKKEITKVKGNRKEIDTRAGSRVSGNVSPDAETSESDAEPGSPLRSRLRKRKLDEAEVDDTATGVVGSSSTIKIRRSDGVKETKDTPEAIIADTENFKKKETFKDVIASSNRKKPESDIQDNVEKQDLHKDNRLRRSLRRRRNRTVEEASDSESDGVEEENVADIRKSLRPRRSQNVDLEREPELERSSKIAKGMIEQPDSDADNDSDDDTDVVPLRKRLRRRSGAKEIKTNDSIQREQNKEDQIDKNTSDSEESEDEFKDDRPHRSPRASRGERKTERSSRTSIRSKTAKDGMLQINSESASSMSEDEGRATPVKERLRERKSLSSNMKEAPDANDVKDIKISKASKLTEKVASGRDRNLRPRRQLRQNGTFVGDVQASIDVIFDAVEEEYDTLKTSELNENDENDKDSVIEIVSESSEDEHMSRSQKQSKTKKKPVKSKAKKSKAKAEKPIVSTCDESEVVPIPEIPKESKSLSVLVDPVEDFGSGIQVQTGKKQSNKKEQKSRNAAIAEKVSDVARANLADDDEFSFVRPRNESASDDKKDTEESSKDKMKAVIIEDDEFSFVSTASTGQKVKITERPEKKIEAGNKPLDNFGSEFLKFTQKQLKLKDTLDDSNVKFEPEKKKSDSDVPEPKSEKTNSSLDVPECHAEKKEIDTAVPEQKQEKMISSKTVTEVKALPQFSDDSGQAHSKDEAVTNQANNETSNFAAAFQAFAGVNRPAEATSKEEAAVPQLSVEGKKIKEPNSELMQSSVKLNINQSMEKPQKDSIKSPVTSPVIGLKKPGFEGAFQEFFQKKLLLSQNRRQEVKDQTNSAAGKPKQTDPIDRSLSTKETSKEVSKRKSLEESMIQCNVQIDRLTEREIDKYTSPKETKLLPMASDSRHLKQDSKTASLRPCKEIAKEPEEIIILDSEDDSQDETSEIVLIDSDDVLSSTEVEDLNDKLQDQSETGQFEKTDSHSVELISHEITEVSEKETDLNTPGHGTDKTSEQQDECTIGEENVNELEIEKTNNKIDIEEEEDIDNAGNKTLDNEVSSQEENLLEAVEFEAEIVTDSHDIQRVEGIIQVEITEPLQDEEKEVCINNAETTLAEDKQTEGKTVVETKGLYKGAESIEESVNQIIKDPKNEDLPVPEPASPGNLEHKEIDKDVGLIEVSKGEVVDSNTQIGKENNLSSLNKMLEKEAFSQEDKVLQTEESEAENIKSNLNIHRTEENDQEDAEQLQDDRIQVCINNAKYFPAGDALTENKTVIEPTEACKGTENVEESVNQYDEEYEKEDLPGPEPALHENFEHRKDAEDFEMVDTSERVADDKNTQIGEEKDLSSLNKLLDKEAFSEKFEEEKNLDKHQIEETDQEDDTEPSHDEAKEVCINEAEQTTAGDKQTGNKTIIETKGTNKGAESMEQSVNQFDTESEKEDLPAYEPALPENFEHKEIDEGVELIDASKRVNVDRNTQIGEEKDIDTVKTVLSNEALLSENEIATEQLSDSCEGVEIDDEVKKLDAGIATQSLEVKDNSFSMEEGLLSRRGSAIISLPKSDGSVESNETEVPTHQVREDVVNSENQTNAINVSKIKVIVSAEDAEDSLVNEGNICLSESQEKDLSFDHPKDNEDANENSIPIPRDAEDSRGISLEKVGEEIQFDIYSKQTIETFGGSTEHTALKEITVHENVIDDNMESGSGQSNTEISLAEDKTQEKSFTEFKLGIPVKESAHLQKENISEEMDVFVDKETPTPEDNSIDGEHVEWVVKATNRPEVQVDENICSAAGDEKQVKIKIVEKEDENDLKLVSNEVCSFDELYNAKASAFVPPDDKISVDEHTDELGRNEQDINDSIQTEDNPVVDNSEELEANKNSTEQNMHGSFGQESLDTSTEVSKDKGDTSLQQKLQIGTDSENPNEKDVDNSIQIEENPVVDNSECFEGNQHSSEENQLDILCQASIDRGGTSLQHNVQMGTDSENSLTSTDVSSVSPKVTVLFPENNVDNTPVSESIHDEVMNSELNMFENTEEKCPNAVSSDADLRKEEIENVDNTAAVDVNYGTEQEESHESLDLSPDHLTKINIQTESMLKTEEEAHLDTLEMESSKLDTCQDEDDGATSSADNRYVPSVNENSAIDELQKNYEYSVILEKEEQIGTHASSTSPLKDKLVPYSDDESEEEISELSVSAGNENSSQESMTEHHLRKDEETEANVGVFDNGQNKVEITATLSVEGKSDELQAEGRSEMSEDNIEMKSEPEYEPNEPLESVKSTKMESYGVNLETRTCELSSDLSNQVDINNEALETSDHETEKLENKHIESTTTIFETPSENVMSKEEEMAFSYLRSIWKEDEIDVVQKETIEETEEDSDDNNETTTTSAKEIQSVQTLSAEGKIGKEETTDEVPEYNETHEEKDTADVGDTAQSLYETNDQNTDDALKLPDESTDTVDSSVEVKWVEPETDTVSNVNLMDSEDTSANNSSEIEILHSTLQQDLTIPIIDDASKEYLDQESSDSYRETKIDTATAVEMDTFTPFQPTMPSVDTQQETLESLNGSMNFKAENEPDCYLQQTPDICQLPGLEEAEENGLKENQPKVLGFDLTEDGSENKADAEENMVKVCYSDSVDGDNEGTDNRPEEISKMFGQVPMVLDKQENVKVAADSEDILETKEGNDSSLTKSEDQVQTLQESDYIATDYNGKSHDGSPIYREVSGEVKSVKISAATEFLQSDEFVAVKLNTGLESETVNELDQIENVQSILNEGNEANTCLTLSDEAVDQGVIKDTLDEQINQEATLSAISSFEPAFISQGKISSDEILQDYTTDISDSKADIQDGEPLKEDDLDTTGHTTIIADTDKKDVTFENENDAQTFICENEPLLKEDENLDSETFSSSADQIACVSIDNISQDGVTSDPTTDSIEHSANVRVKNSLMDDLNTTEISQEKKYEQCLRESDVQNEVEQQADVLVDEIGIHDTHKDELNQEAKNNDEGVIQENNATTDSTDLATTLVDDNAEQESGNEGIDQKVKSYEVNHDVTIPVEGIISTDDKVKDVVIFDSVKGISESETDIGVGKALIEEYLETTGQETVTIDDNRIEGDEQNTVKVEMYQKVQMENNIQKTREDNDATALSITKDVKTDTSAITEGEKYESETDLQQLPEFDVNMEMNLDIVSEIAETTTVCTPSDSDQKLSISEMVSDKIQGQQELDVTSDLSTSIVSSQQKVDSQMMDKTLDLVIDKKSSDIDPDMTSKVAEEETVVTNMPLILTARFYKSPPREAVEQKSRDTHSEVIVEHTARDTDSKVSLLEGQNQIKVAGKSVKKKATEKESREKTAGKQTADTVQSTSKTIRKEECTKSKQLHNKVVVEKELITQSAKDINVPSSGERRKSVPKSISSVIMKTNNIGSKEMEPSQTTVTAKKTKERRSSVKKIDVPVEEGDKDDLEEFSKRTESVKKSLRKKKGKGYQCDFNLEDDDHDDRMSTCSSSSSGTSFGSHGLDLDSLKVVPGPSHATPEAPRTVSPSAECSSPEKNTVSTITAKIVNRKTYTTKRCVVSKVMADSLKKYSKGPIKRLVVIKHQDLANIPADVGSLSDKTVLPLDGSDLVRRVSLPNIGKVTKQYTKFSLPLRDEPESPKSVSSESNSGSESGGNDTTGQTPNPWKSFRGMHSEDAPFFWGMDEEETCSHKVKGKRTDSKGDKSTVPTVKKDVGHMSGKGDQSVAYSRRRRGSDIETNSSQTVEQKTKTASGDEKEIKEGRRRLRSPSATKEPQGLLTKESQGLLTKTTNVQRELSGVRKISESKTISNVETKLPDVTKELSHATRGAVKSSTVSPAVKSSTTPLGMSNKPVIDHKSNKVKLALTSKEKSDQQTLSIKQVKESHVKPSTIKSVDSVKSSAISKKELEKAKSFASSKTRSLSMRHLLTQTGVMTHVPETLATDVDGTIIPDTIIAESTASSTIVNSANLAESVRIESQKEGSPPLRGVKRKSGHSEMENPSHEGKRQNKSSDIDRSPTMSKGLDKQSQSESQVEMCHTVVDNLSKPAAKQPKLSEEVKSGHEISSSVKKTEMNLKVIVLESNKTEVGKCTCQSSNSFCEECKKRQRAQKPSGSKLVYSSYKPAIRHIVHDGKVIQIKKGSITETDIVSTGAGYRSQSPKSRDISPQPSERRNRLGSATESPKKKKSRTSNVKSEDSVETLETSLYVKTEADLNKYIHETLKEIRKDRQHHRPPEHNLRQPKQETEKEESKWKVTKTKDSYTFKRSRPIT